MQAGSRFRYFILLPLAQHLTFNHVSFYVLYRTTHFLTRIEDIKRVKYLFHIGEKRAYLFTIHEGEVGSTDDAVVVFSCDGAVGFSDKLIDFW